GTLLSRHAYRPAHTAPSPLSLHDALPISHHGDDGCQPLQHLVADRPEQEAAHGAVPAAADHREARSLGELVDDHGREALGHRLLDRKSTRLNSSHVKISYAVFCLKKKTT